METLKCGSRKSISCLWLAIFSIEKEKDRKERMKARERGKKSLRVAAAVPVFIYLSISLNVSSILLSTIYDVCGYISLRMCVFNVEIAISFYYCVFNIGVNGNKWDHISR